MAFHPFVMRVLQRCRVPAKDVPDVAQNVLTQLLPWWTGRPHADVEDPADTGRGYVRVTAVHSAWRHLRAEARRGESPAWEPDWLGEGDEPDTPPPRTTCSPEEQWLELEAAVGRIAETDLDRLAAATDPAYWRAFYAHAIVGASVAQIAEAEGAPLSTIYARIRYARRDLRVAILRRRMATRAR